MKHTGALFLHLKLKRLPLSFIIVFIISLVADQKLSRDEFDILLKVSKDMKETNYLNHFRAADSNQDGYVTAEEMRERFKQLGKTSSLSSVRAFIRQSDKNNDAKLDYNGKE